MTESGSIWRRRPPTVVGDELPGQVQDLVIGAGITGLVTGLLLARAGRRVAVVDAGAVGAGTTGSSSAKVSLLQGTHLSEIARRHPPDVTRAYLEANREGQAWLRRFCETHGVPIQTRTAITFAETTESVSKLEREFVLEQDLGLESTWLSELAVPFDVAAAISLEEQAQVDPLEVLQMLADQVQKHEGSVCPHHRVVDVDASSDLIRVRYADGAETSAAHVVLATGTPILDRGFHFARLEANRSYVIALADAEAPDGMFLSVPSPSKPTVSIRDVPDRDLVLVGGFGHVVGRTKSELGQLNGLRAWADRVFPGSTEVAAWSAQDYSSFDAVAEASVLPWSDGRIHIATGYGKWGLTNGVAAALAISADTLGEKPDWAQRLESRLTGRASIHSLGDLARFNLAVASSMVRTMPARVTHERPVCSHLGGVLCWNDAESTWDCPLHGSRFTAGGEVIEGPAVRPMKRNGATVPTQAQRKS
ncbi:MAG TPA: FAD-dependent oxidoreductase [Aeromicrobium sp.]|nr:FAD-dependent oxidoreductase [Aeromicrobium sp.]